MPNYHQDEITYAELCGRFTTAPTKLRITSASNGLPTALGAGRYVMVSDSDCYFRQTSGTMTVATTNAFFLPAGAFVGLTVTGTDDTNIVAITGGASGYVDFSKRTVP